jgi:hypothetical protein
MTSPDPIQTAALRGILIDTVEQSASLPARTRQRRVRTTFRAGLIAAPLAAAIAITVGVVGPGGASASAAEALRSAADITITTSDPFVAPGQYLKVTTEAAYLAYESDADGQLTAYLSPSMTEVFIPAQPAQEWVQKVTVEPATEFYGAASRAAAQSDWAETVRGDVVRVTRAAEGNFAQADELGGEIAEVPLPDNPEQALAFLHGRPYGDGTHAGALAFAAQLLRDGTMPASQRSVLYRALALLPGIRITDGSAVLDGRTGIAFSLDADVDTPEIIVDPTTGLFIGERTLTADTHGAIPAGTVRDYTAVSTAVVDEAP